MPTAVDLSSWNSLWTLARIRQSGYRPKLRETLFEFRFAYAVTAGLGVVFVVLGSFIFYGTGSELPNNNALFAHEVVTLYTRTIGEWSHVVISASAFSVMFGTILAVFDGYSRSMRRTLELMLEGRRGAPAPDSRAVYVVILLVLAAGGLVTVLQFGDNLRALVDFATVLSFVIAPVIAGFNFRLVLGRFLEERWRPAALLRGLSYAGSAFLAGFAAIFLATRFL